MGWIQPGDYSLVTGRVGRLEISSMGASCYPRHYSTLNLYSMVL